MRRITFDVSDDMYRKIDQILAEDGFGTRSEFLRFLILTYFREKDIQSKPAPKYKEYEEPEINLEFGIPVNVIRKIEEVAKQMGENERQQLS